MVLTGSAPYTVEVTGFSDTTGSYLMRVVEPVQQPFTIADGASVSPDAPGPGAGRIPGPGDSDLFTLSGVNSGASVFITPTAATPDQSDRDCSSFSGSCATAPATRSPRPPLQPERADRAHRHGPLHARGVRPV